MITCDRRTHDWFYRLWALVTGILLTMVCYMAAHHREHHEQKQQTGKASNWTEQQSWEKAKR